MTLLEHLDDQVSPRGSAHVIVRVKRLLNSPGVTRMIELGMNRLDREVAVLEALIGYLMGTVSLNQLEERTALLVFEAAARPGDSFSELLLTVELYLAELSRGDRSRQEFRNLIAGMAHDYNLELRLDDAVVTRQRTGTTSVTIGGGQTRGRDPIYHLQRHSRDDRVIQDHVKPVHALFLSLELNQ